VSARTGGARSGNQGRASVWDRVATLANLRDGARANLGVFRTGPWTGDTVDVRLLERHPLSTQLFVPMTAGRWLVIVAPPGPEPDVTAVRAFLVRPDQGVTYRPGVWHHPLIALDSAADFVCLVWEDGTAADCEVRPIDGPLVRVPPV
jgi:ureidoglycolate lyase